jgi:hypothetical protein
MKRDEVGRRARIIDEEERQKNRDWPARGTSECACLPGERSRAGMKSGRFERTQEGLAAELAGLPPVA